MMNGRMLPEEVADRIIREILGRPVDYIRLAAEQAARTDPWRWYCRLCGARGEAADPGTRDAAARAHLESEPCGRHDCTGWAEAGRLLHVWTYPRSVIAWLS
jgi:hypothetical protein